VYPSAESETPGYQNGGWILIGLKPEVQKGNAKGFLRFELIYTKTNGQTHKCIKEIDFSEAEKAKEEGKKNWASSEGIAKAMVLKQYVDGMKDGLSYTNVFYKDSARKGFQPEFLEWFEQQGTIYNFEKEKGAMKKINRNYGTKRKKIN